MNKEEILVGTDGASKGNVSNTEYRNRESDKNHYSIAGKYAGLPIE